MAAVAGRTSYFKLGSTDISAFLDEKTLEIAKDLADSHTFGDTWKEAIATLISSTLNGAGPADYSASGLDATLWAAVSSTSATTFEFGPSGSTAGMVKYSGSAHIIGYSQSSSVGDRVNASYTAQVTGAVTRGTF